jgi:YHS domain-containing protein
MWKSVCLLLLSTIVSQAQSVQENSRTGQFNLGKNKLALEGYDPASYFSGKPTKGKSSFSTTHKGVVYYFASAQNKVLFTAHPENYEPEYGGWCAYAMGAKGEKVEVDPENFKVKNGKLYLFYRNFFSNTLDDWNKDEASLMKKADSNWAKTNP